MPEDHYIIIKCKNFGSLARSLIFTVSLLDLAPGKQNPGCVKRLFPLIGPIVRFLLILFVCKFKLDF